MMTWTNILKKAVNFGLVGVVAGMVLLNSGIAGASDMANCIGQNYTPPHNEKSTTCSTNHCADQKGSEIDRYIWKSVQNNTQSSCLNQMPIGQGANINVSAITGVRTDKNKNGDGTRNHDGVDVGTGGQENVALYAAAAGKVVPSLPMVYTSKLSSGNTWNAKTKSGSKIQKCANGITYIILQHKRGSSTQKNCDVFYTAYLHSYNILVKSGDTVARGQRIATVGGCSGYPYHMHYEIRDCDGTVYNPLCTNGVSSPQKLCDGSTDIVPPASPASNTDSSPASVQLEDCNQYKTENIKAAALQKCEALIAHIPVIARTPNNSAWKEVAQKYKDCKEKAEYDALTNGTKNLMDYNACEKRNSEKKIAAGNFSSPWSQGGEAGKGTFNEFQSNYQCNIAENFSSIQGCIFCNLFKIIFDTASSVAKACHSTFASSMIKLLTIGLAIGLAWLVMKYVSDMTVKDPGMMLNEIFRKIFVVAFIILLLNLDVARFFEIFVSPVFDTGFTLASLVMDNATIGNWNVDGSGLPATMGNSMLSAINAIQERLEKLMALGSNAICTALYVESYNRYPIFPHFGYLLTGVFLWLIALVFMLCYPFLLIDSVLQFTIASALFPVALASTAFKITYNYLNIFKVIQIFMNAMFVFIFLTIVLFILLAGIDDAVKPVIEQAYEASASFFSLETLVWYSKVFVKLVFFLFLGKSVLEDIPSFAENFASAITLGQGMSSTDLGAGRKLGGLAVGAATKGATQLGAPVISAGIHGVRKAGSIVSHGTADILKNARYSYLVNHTMNKAATAGLGAGAVVTGRDWFGRRVARRVVTNADGSLALESSRKGMFNKNNTYTIRQNGLMSIKTKVDALGMKKESYNIKSASYQSLINRDGTRNEFAINSLMQSSGLTENEKNKVILNQMLKQRMPRDGSANLEGGFLKEEIINTKDAQGRSVFQVRRIDTKGNIQVFSMTKGGSRDLIEYETISKDGEATKWSSDGILQKKDTYQYDMNEDKSFQADNQVTINGAQVKDTQVSSNGTLLDKDGNALGMVQANGNIVDAGGQVIGTATPPQLAFDKDGLAIGKITADGVIVDDKGNVKATIGEDGTITDKQGRNVIGQLSEEQRAACYKSMKIKAGSRKVEFSHSKAFKGQQIFDEDGTLNWDMRNEELMFGQSDLELYQIQMKKYGDVLQHNRFGR